MTVIEDYAIIQYLRENKILIILPQTDRTITNTVQKVVNRRIGLTSDEEAALLISVKTMLEANDE